MFLLGCEDVLEEDNTNAITIGEAFNTLDDARSGLIGAYSVLRSPKVYQQGGYSAYWGDLGVDLLTSLFFNDYYNETFLYKMTPGTLIVSETWSEYYKALKVVNSFIVKAESIANTQGDATFEEKKNEILAEAFFIRAVLYFNLTKIFGDVPLILSSDNTLDTVDAESNMPSSPAEIIYQQVEKDLLFAEEWAMTRGEANSTDIVTVEAAQALLARVYLQMTTKRINGGVEGGIDQNNGPVSANQRYQMAKTYLEKVMAAGYELEENYGDIFEPSNERSNTEVIFAVGFTGPSQNVGSDWGTAYGPLGNGTVGSWNAFRVYLDFAREYLEPDGIFTRNEADPSMWDPDPQRFGGGRFVQEVQLLGSSNFISDSRFDRNIATFNASALLEFSQGTSRSPLVQLENEAIWNWTPHKYRKPIPNERDPSDGDNDFPLIRYADILLMYAEVENALNGPTPLAYEQINKVRDRAFKDFIIKEAPTRDNEGNALVYPDPNNDEPGTPLSVRQELAAQNTVPNKSFDLTPGLSKEQFLDSLLLERKKELCFEGLRKDDLIRNGKLKEILNGIIAESSSGDVAGLPKDNFNAPKHYHWPIPAREIALNPVLNQNCGYSGGGACN